MQIIEVTDFGVRSAVIRLRRRETPLQFVLYPMIHMAKPAFYTAVTVRLKRADVLAVGFAVQTGEPVQQLVGGAGTVGGDEQVAPPRLEGPG